MIDVHQLRYALAAAETGSFSRAADQFRVKQSTLSKRIRHLELRLGLPLFERTTQGVIPTAVGARILARAQAIVCDLEALSADSRALARGNAGSLRLGFQGSLATGDLRAVLEAHRLACPEIEVEATEGSREALLTMVDQDWLDVAIVGGDCAPSPQRRTLCLWSECLLIGIAPNHTLADRDPLYWTDLRGMTFVVTNADPGQSIATMISARLSGASSSPRIVRQAVSRDNLLSFAGADCVIATIGYPSLADPAVSLRAVHDAFGPTRVDQVLHWRPDNSNAALARFLALVTRRYGRSEIELAGR